MSLWKSITRRLRRHSAEHRPPVRPARGRTGWFRPALLALEDRTVPAGADLFADATLLAGSFAADTGDNTAATGELGEPTHAGDQVTNSVWWRWTAPANGPVEINTFGSAFDTVLGVYTGDAVGSLALVGDSDDAPDSVQSRVVFDAVAGTTYRIAVDGFGTEKGDVALHLGMTPPNDDFASAGTVTAATQTGSNILATAEPGELPLGKNGEPVNSVWWRWTAPADGPAQVDTLGSDFDTQLAVYTAAGDGTLTLVGANDDADPDAGILQSQFPFDAAAGTTYYFAVDGYLDQTGIVVLNVNRPESQSNRAPSVESQSFGVDEGSFAGTVVGTVSASDPDAGQTLTYAITGGNAGDAFSIDHGTGEIKVLTRSALDFETSPAFDLTVTVTDSGDPNLSASATVRVNLGDVNESPAFTAAGPFDVNEHSPTGTPVGPVAAADPDAGQTLTYSIVAGNEAGGFAIDPASGAITVADGSALDHATTPSVTLTVRVTDSGSPALFADAAVTITVNDANEPPAIDAQSFAADEGTPDGTPLGVVAAADPDPGQVLTYAITAGNDSGAFSIGPDTGLLAVAGGAALDFEQVASFTLTVTVTDNGSPALSSSAEVTVNLADRNDAPVLDNTGAMSLREVKQGAANPGTPVSDVLASAGGTRVTDQDAGAKRGIAVFYADTANGSWQFSTDGGATWNALGPVSPTSARLLAADASTLLRFLPNSGYTGTVVQGVAFWAWDQTSGTNGGLANGSSGGGYSAFSAESETASVAVGAAATPNPAARLICLLAGEVRVFASWGLLGNGAATSLLCDLNNATRKLSDGDIRHAVESLRSFVSKVKSPLCSSAGALPRLALTTSANLIIAVLLV